MRTLAVLSVLLPLIFSGALFSGTSFSGTALAAGLSPTRDLSPDKAWNPWPDPEDCILPMPCNGQLILRAVAVPIKTGILDDLKFPMGVNNSARPERDIYERRFEGSVSAPFTLRDLPEAWRKALQKPHADKFLYFFIGKYEISVRQWRLVMEDSCPAGNPGEAELRPKTAVSWYDIQRFLGKYMQWLLEHDKASLPLFAENDKDIGFLRLPSEEEWEFAARGGMNVPEEYRSQEDFHPLKEYADSKKEDASAELTLGDFAVYQSGDRIHRDPAPIGSRKPNPLRIYDMAGNARELTRSAFRFSIAERWNNTVARRLHGSSGGLVTKGGSFLSGEESILPGARDEAPLFRENGIFSTRDLGFRPVLSGINTPGGARSGMLREAGGKISGRRAGEDAPVREDAVRQEANADLPVKIDPAGSLLSELDKVIAGASSSTVKDNLSKYRGMVVENLSAAERLHGDISMNAVRITLFDAEALINLAYRIHLTDTDYQELRKKSVKAKLPRGELQQYETFIRELKGIFTSVINRYKQNLETLAEESADTLQRHFAVIRKEYAGGGLLDRHMRDNLGALEKHLAQVHAKGIGSLAKARIAKDIVPPAYRPRFDF